MKNSKYKVGLRQVSPNSWEVINANYLVVNYTSILRGETFKYVYIPEGFKTDLASVPRIFWSIIPPFGRYTDASVLHDFLYRTQPDWCSKDRADEIFLNYMKKSGVPTWKRTVMYTAVRLFGKRSYEKSKKRLLNC